MNLKEYLDKISEEDIEEFAKKGGFCRASVYRWINGYKPRRKHAKKIVEQTKGKVTFEDLRGDK